MKISTTIKTKTGFVWIGTVNLNNPFGNMLDAIGLGNPNAVAGEFETMVFKCDKDGKVEDWDDLDKANYSTEEEAIKGHEKMCEKWKN